MPSPDQCLHQTFSSEPTQNQRGFNVIMLNPRRFSESIPKDPAQRQSQISAYLIVLSPCKVKLYNNYISLSQRSKTSVFAVNYRIRPKHSDSTSSFYGCPGYLKMSYISLFVFPGYTNCTLLYTHVHTIDSVVRMLAADTVVKRVH